MRNLNIGDDLVFTARAWFRRKFLRYTLIMFVIQKIVAGAAFAVAATLFSVAQNTEPAPTSDRPLVEVDLHKLGYEQRMGEYRTKTFLDFLDNDHLAFVWQTFVGTNKGRGLLTPSPSDLHVVVFEPLKGRKILETKLSSLDFPVCFLGLADGNSLTVTGNTVTIFSPAFKIIRHQKLEDNQYHCGSVSPSKKSLLLFSTSGLTETTQILNTLTLASRPIRTKSALRTSISDTWIASACGNPPQLCVEEVGGNIQPFHPGERNLTITKPRLPAWFVDNDSIMMEGKDGMLVTTVAGRLVFEHKLLEKHSLEPPAVSAKSDRFAVIEDRLRGVKNDALDLYPFPSNDRVLVFSISQGHAIYTVKLKGTSPWWLWQEHRSQVTLSPDGTLLAVLSDETLRVYRIPR